MGLIQCKDVCKSFGEKVALDHVSVDIPKGKIFGLLGPNGSGKTTLIKFLLAYIIGRDPKSANMYISYSDGMTNTTRLEADSATLIHNHKKESPRPFAGLRALFTGNSIQYEKNSCIHEINANTLVIESYSVQKITGKDVTIGKDCIIDKVIATTKLRIHKSAQVKDFIGSVMPEYFE